MIGNTVHFWIALGTGLLLCVSNGTALAQAAADKAAADALFEEGKKLIGKGDNAAACEKFEASLSKLTQLGTQLALAACYEKLGKTASAWGAFRTAAIAASKAHDKRQRSAEERAAALEANLSKLVIKIEPTNRIDGLKVKRDGGEVMPAEFGSPVPLDPGEHTVEASAPGRVAWSTKVLIPLISDIVEVTVPVLEKVPALRPVRRTQRILSYGLAGAGIAAIDVSLIFGAVASTKWSDAKLQCDGRACDQVGIDLAHRARFWGNVSTATFAGGVVALAAGVVLFLTAPSVGTENVQATHPTTLHLVPHFGPAQAGLTIQGGF